MSGAGRLSGHGQVGRAGFEQVMHQQVTRFRKDPGQKIERETVVAEKTQHQAVLNTVCRFFILFVLLCFQLFG